MVSMTSYWNAYKLDIPMERQMAMAMAMIRISSERKPPSMPLSHDEDHTMIGISPRVLYLIRTMTYTWYELRVRDWIVGLQTIRKWRSEDGVTLADPASSSLYLFTSLDHGPVQMASVRVCTTSGDKSSGGGVSPCAGSAERLP
jgi:hypothetical protein